MKKSIAAVGILMATAITSVPSFAASCDKKCMEGIGDQYRAAYLKHNPKLAPFASKVRYKYRLTDGTKTRSVFREPHTWAFLESFKVKNDTIVAVEATFVAAPYYMRAPWTKKPDMR
ncbi:MAG: hypothetical protein WDO68_00995 [Gammaproteobacteria bacterium]